MIEPRVRWYRPWWLTLKYRGACLPPFGIWIDHGYRNTSYGQKILDHELVHWEQFHRNPFTYYLRHSWYLLVNTPPRKNPLEVEAYERSGVW